MGIWLTEKWNKLEKRYKLAFFATFCMGLLTHLYMLTNKLPNHDYVYNIHGDQLIWPLSLGRWFLNAVTSLSSYFSLPWVIGVLTILYLALAAVFVIAILDLYRPVPILLCCGLLATYPALADTLGYMFTADGYLFAMFLSALAVWFWQNKKGLYGVIGCSIFLSLAVGIYQAYLSFAIYLILIRLILDIFEQKYTDKELLKKGGLALAGGACGMILYYIGLLIMMKYHGVSFADYMGIDETAVPGISRIFSTLFRDTIAFAEMFIGGNSDFTAYELLNMVFIIMLFAAYIMIFIKTKLYKRKLQAVLLVVASLLFIPAAYIFDFISQDVIYRFLMLYCLVLLYLLLVKLTDAWLAGWFAETTMVLIAAIVLNFGLIDNIAYYNLNLCWEQTYATAIQMQERITALDEYAPEKRILITGTIETNDREWLQSRIPYLIGTDDVNLMRNQSFIITILNVDLGMNLDGVNNEERERTLASEAYDRMPCWPAGDSVQVIDDVIVIKLSEN